MTTHPIRIAAALIDDGAGHMLLVRKHGAQAYMQAGGKIEPGETAMDALRRELLEEIGLVPATAPAYLGRFRAPAANEPGRIVEAEIFRLTAAHPPIVAAEIAEARWVAIKAAGELPLAPLTRDHILPIARALPAYEKAPEPRIAAPGP
ncbi:NUDIX domain-containing protein [Sphingomonas sp. HF-S4]|uniref:NUDIX domain-containing protein n=1 Tax=Sphingomonas agrestis TaxID=3080540 RepID=A0ABU3Y778_9SPHN|nr:NUDIX domain-containing protein [Sphingomonas sp. HF-S4]MDV3457028.1 NUDIX domain-containing protein [Sphingomonas sp. HF-S4]